MPLIVKLPYNKAYIKKYSTYTSHLNVLDRKKTAVQRQLSRGGLGSYEPDFQASLLSLCEICRDPIVVYDLGAHIGLYSALIATIFKRRAPHIISFEPTPTTAKEARILRDKNYLAYTIIETAISDTHGNVDLFISDKAETSNSLNSRFRKSSEKIRVPLTTIDRFVQEGFLPPKIMKIDVETFEADVLRGALKVINKYKPFITLEILEAVDKEAILSMIKAIECFGYVFYQVENDEKNWEKRSADQVLSNISSAKRDWICSYMELTSDFFSAKQNWKASLLKCTQKTNVFVDAGKPISLNLFSDY